MSLYWSIHECLEVLPRPALTRHSAAKGFAPCFPAIRPLQCPQSTTQPVVPVVATPLITTVTVLLLYNFNKKWHPHAQRKAYLDAFSPINFGSLYLGQQAEHSLSNCNACAKMHAELQLAYPGLPSYSAPSNWFSRHKNTLFLVVGEHHAFACARSSTSVPLALTAVHTDCI